MDSIQKIKYYEGDYIRGKETKEVYIIDSINHLFVKVKHNNKIYEESISIFEPIPLTQEFLYKNSYSVYNTPNFNQYALDEKYVIKEIDNKFYFNGVELLYVHELQHLIDLLKIDKQLEI